MRKAILGIVLILALISAGCSFGQGTHKPHLYRGDEKAAEAYIKSKGYLITGYKGQLNTYTLQRSLLRETWYAQIWSVQNEPPENYYGREITTYGFVVDHHPLSQKYHFDTDVYLMMTGGKVVGGYSFPHSDPPMVGAVFSLEGKDLEERTGLTYTGWKDQWDKKYGDKAAD